MLAGAAVREIVAHNGTAAGSRLVNDPFGQPMLAGHVGRQAVLVLEAVATGGALDPLLRDVMGDEVLHKDHQHFSLSK